MYEHVWEHLSYLSSTGFLFSKKHSKVDYWVIIWLCDSSNASVVYNRSHDVHLHAHVWVGVVYYIVHVMLCVGAGASDGNGQVPNVHGSAPFLCSTHADDVGELSCTVCTKLLMFKCKCTTYVALSKTHAARVCICHNYVHVMICSQRRYIVFINAICEWIWEKGPLCAVAEFCF